MALNQFERRILIHARTLLVSRATSRICYAITYAEQFLHETTPHSRRAQIQDASARQRIFIMGAIEQEFGLESWVAKKLPGSGAQLNDARMRATRIAWIDWLLDEPWTDWSGGACPLLDGEHVIIRMRNGDEMGHNGSRRADTVRWCNAVDMRGLADWATNYDVVAYKVIYEAPNAE